MGPSDSLHRRVRRGNVERVREWLDAHPNEDVNAWDSRGYTPLMYAVVSSRADVMMIRLLLEQGADVHLRSRDHLDETVVSLCLRRGDFQKLTVLLDAGADLHYRRESGYNAAVDAALGTLEFLNLVISHGVDLNAVSQYRESALSLSSREGCFDRVLLLLDSGADERLLEWTPLIRAVVLNNIEEVRRVLDGKPDLEARDRWSRTAYLTALQSGDLAKAQLLLDHGADPNARGVGGRPALFYANHIPTIKWLLERGEPVDEKNDYGETPLMRAVEHDWTEGVDELLRAGANANARGDSSSAMGSASTRDIATLLLQAGGDVAELSYAGRRSVLGLAAHSDDLLLTASLEEFRSAWNPRFGAGNPEPMNEPFWESMIRSGVSAYEARMIYGGGEGDTPVWCAQRFGQSMTFLPDGRIIQIGGEHEDFYDEDFCIYNDVFVHHPDGRIDILGYPREVFPPTDFHTATLIGRHMYVIGSLGYEGERQHGKTQVFQLDIETLRLERLELAGEAPGWISRHRAEQTGPHEIRLTGGFVVTCREGKDDGADNNRSFVLDLARGLWRTNTA